MQLLVTGGAGFIGSHFVRRMLRADDVERVTVLDALTYAGSRGNLGQAFLNPKLDFVVGNICDAALVEDLMAQHTAVVHFAAESHVDRSFTTAGTFVTTNVIGTQTLADAAMRHGITKFVHVSTDEVYGPLLEGAATEDYPLRPTVPTPPPRPPATWSPSATGTRTERRSASPAPRTTTGPASTPRRSSRCS